MGQKALNKRHEESQQKMNTVKFQLDESKTELLACKEELKETISKESFDAMMTKVEEQNERIIKENSDLNKDLTLSRNKMKEFENENKKIKEEKDNVLAEVGKCKELQKKREEETQVVIKTLHEKAEQEAIKCTETRKKTEERVR